MDMVRKIVFRGVVNEELILPKPMTVESVIALLDEAGRSLGLSEPRPLRSCSGIYRRLRIVEG